MDTSNYESMTKDELIQYIEELKKQRAFTYDDRIKLEILDHLPFTVWASDRNCIIKYWGGKCEALYGFKAEDALGKDFVELFVAEDEKLAARKDQLSIIDYDVKFHNIANDVAKTNNTLRLLTNCARFQDPITGEYWNGEIGLIIDYFEQEKEILRQHISESKQMKKCINDFLSEYTQLMEEFEERCNNLRREIRECEEQSIKVKKRKEFKVQKNSINEVLLEIKNSLRDSRDDYNERMIKSSSYDNCKSCLLDWRNSCRIILERVDDVLMDVKEIEVEYSSGSSEYYKMKDSLLTFIGDRRIEVYQQLSNLENTIGKEIEDYRSIGRDIDASSPALKRYNEMQSSIPALKKSLEDITKNAYTSIHKHNDSRSIDSLRLQRETIISAYDSLEVQIRELEMKVRQ